MNRSLLLALALSSLAGAAVAQEAIATRPADSPSPQASAAPVESLDAPTPSQADGAEWARRVLARANGQLPSSEEEERRAALEASQGGQGGCVRNPDRSPHGSVTVAAGSGGYRGGGMVVTQPVGDCGSVTIGISSERGGGFGRRYR